MSVITVNKPYDEVHEQIFKRGDLPVVVLGCDKCAKTCKTGGAVEVREMRDRVRESGLMLREVSGLVDAVEEGLCDPEAVRKRLKPLFSETSDFQAVVLSCGAGLKCLQDLLPKARIVPALDTLGPGVKAELACIACGDCQFGSGGCKMLRVVQGQAEHLAHGYGVS